MVTFNGTKIVIQVSDKLYMHVFERQNMYKIYLSKMEKVPRGIQGEKSSKDMANSRNLVSLG